MSTERRSLGVFSRKRPLGENGERLCYNCLGPLPKHRRFNCSPQCSEKWRIRTSPAHMRFLVFQRDHGVCAVCHIDTVALQSEYNKLPKRDIFAHKIGARDRFIHEYGIPSGRVATDWWDADHIVPVIEGGGECDLSNFRTLCLPCHKIVTRELRGRITVAQRIVSAERNDRARPLFEGLECKP